MTPDPDPDPARPPDPDDPDLDAYLRHATRGLWGRARRDLRAELRGHLEARRAELLPLTRDSRAALRQALRELGLPRHVSGGMARVYALPALARGTALGVAPLALALAALLGASRGLTQVPGFHPAYTLLPGPFTYVDARALQDELRRSGVRVSGPPERPVLAFPGRTAPVPVAVEAGEREPYLARQLLRDYPTGRVFLDANTLATSVLTAGLGARVEGWLNPTLVLGPARVRLGGADGAVNAYALYGLALAPLARAVAPGGARSVRWSSVELFETHRLRAPGPAGVYALATLRPRPNGGPGAPLVLTYDLARPDAAGVLTFLMPYGVTHLRLRPDAATLAADAGRVRDWREAGGADSPAPAVLLRLSGQLAERDGPYAVLPLDAPSTAR